MPDQDEYAEDDATFTVDENGPDDGDTDDTDGAEPGAVTEADDDD